MRRRTLLDRVKSSIINWLMRDKLATSFPICDFERLSYEIRPCDVLLVEGRSRVSDIIRLITQSPWSHAALYIGRLHDIQNPLLRERVQEFYKGQPDEQLVVESLLGKGTIITPLTRYRDTHLRICRPKGISSQDAQQVIGFSIGRLGMEYAVRHIIDLARFLVPLSILPRRWRSSLFVKNPSTPTKEICSSMLAEAFGSVNFPILPFVKGDKRKGLSVYQRNPRLYTPSDFDYSPYFEIIKYPIFELTAPPGYRDLPWQSNFIVNDEADLPNPPPPGTQEKP